MRISDWSSDVCSSDLPFGGFHPRRLRIDRLLQNLIDRALNKHRSIIMQNDGPPEINFIALTADIVSAHVSNNSVAISDLPMLIQKVNESLRGMKKSAEAPPALRKSTRLNSRH